MAIRPPSHGTFWTEETARGVDGAGILLALLLLGFAYLWGTIAVIGVIDAAVKREIRYTLTWWAIVFPTVTLTTAWLELAVNSPSSYSILEEDIVSDLLKHVLTCST